MKKHLLCFLIASLLPVFASAEIAVVTSIRPLQLIALAIVGDRAQVSALVDARQSPHHYNMSPSDRLTIARSQLLIWIDPEFEVYLGNIFPAQAKNKSLITVSALKGIKLEHETSGQIDPHLWLDSQNARVLAAAITEKVSELDTGNASFYRENLSQFEAETLRLDAELSVKFNQASQQSYVVYHNAYRYFENRFGLSHHLVMLRNPEAQPSVQEIISVRSRLKDMAPRCLLIEPDANPAIIQTMLGGLTLNTITVDLLGDRIANGSDGYLRLLRALASNFQQCIY